MSVLDPKGTFYLFVNIKKTGLNSIDASDIILKEAHVLTIPGIAFGECGEGYVRIACTVGVERLKEAFDRIEKMSSFLKIKGGKTMNEKVNLKKLDSKSILKFLIPSVLGVFIFLFPIPWKGSINIPIGIISDWLATTIKPIAPILITTVILISAIFSTITTIFKPKSILNNNLLKKLFVTSNLYLVFRIVGAVVVVLVFTKSGPEFIISGDTGGTMMSLLATLIAWFFAASFLIPLLMDYGVMDYTGTLIRNFTKPLFKLPGRSAIDLVASWVGNCNVGVVLTSTQYEQGYYTSREAITIATCFSAVSLPFCLVIAAMLKVDHLFIPFYLILTITGNIKC